MILRKLLAATLALAAAFAVSSCSNMPTGGASMAAYDAYDSPAKQPQNRGAVLVKVSLRNQMLYVMEGSEPLLVTPVSIGTPSKPTPQGSYRIFKKTHRHRANSHGFAYSGNQAKKTYLASKPAGWSFKGTPMPYWCEFKPNYGIHTGWMKPYPCTHGCLRMHHNVAPKFFQMVSVGTPVHIASSQPEDATIGRNVPRPPDASPLPDFAPSWYLSDAAFTHHKPVRFE
jgi:lipoprotein-anchoring transpeptidase ErfK/SrfK